MLPSFPQTLPPWPSSRGHQPLSRGPDGGTRQEPSGIFPRPSNPTPSALCASPQSPPSSLPPGSLSVFTICQLGSLNTLYTESQPAKRGELASPSPASRFLWAGGTMGAGRKSVSFQLKVIMTIVSLQSMFSLTSWNSWAGGWGEEGRAEVPVSEGQVGGWLGGTVWLSQVT